MSINPIDIKEIGHLCLSSGFGEIAIHWQKFSQVNRVPEYKNLTWEAELCVDDPRGCEQLVPLLPNVKCLGMGSHNTARIIANKLPGDARLRDHLPGPIYPTVDQWCEAGNHIKDYLPEIPIDYHYPIAIPPDSRLRAKKLISLPYIVIYTSALGRLFMRGLWAQVWDNLKWASLCRILESRTKLPIYLIGAKRDADMLSTIVASGAIPSSRVLIQRPLTDVLALIEQATYMIGFPAGPGILAGILNTPHCLFFRSHAQKNQRGMFTDPRMIEDGRAYLPFFSESPHVVASEITERMLTLKLLNQVQPVRIMDSNGIGDDILNTLISMSSGFRLEQLHGVLTPEDIHLAHVNHPLHYPLYFALGKYRRPTKVLEIGVGKGYAAAALLEGAHREGRKVPSYFCMDHQSLDYCSSMLQRFTASWPKRPSLFSEQSSSTSLTAKERLHKLAPFDLILLDGATDYHTVMQDLAFAQEILGRGGLLILNNITNSDIPEVRKAYLEFCTLRGKEPAVAKSLFGWGLWLN